MKKIFLVFAALMLAAVGTSAAPPPKYFVDEAKLPFDQIAGIPTQRLWGVELTFTDNDPPEEMRSFLIANGFAWAGAWLEPGPAGNARPAGQLRHRHIHAK